MQVRMDQQQPDSQIFNHFNVGGLIGLAGFVGIKTDLSDFGRIAQEFLAFLGQNPVLFRLTQPQSIQ